MEVVRVSLALLQCLGQVGTVVKSVGNGNVMVSIAGYRWVLNPRCLHHAPGEQLAPDNNRERNYHTILHP